MPWSFPYNRFFLDNEWNLPIDAISGGFYDAGLFLLRQGLTLNIINLGEKKCNLNI